MNTISQKLQSRTLVNDRGVKLTKVNIVIICLLVTFFMVGCDSYLPLQASLSDYQQRIYRLANIEPDTPIEAKAFLFPPKSQLQIEETRVSANWSDFFSSVDCPELQQLISERNSATGKRMEAMTRLLYEFQLLRLWQYQCQMDSQEFSEDWLQAFNDKQNQLPKVIWNTTWASDYWQKAFSNSTLGARNDPVSSQQTLAAMAQIRQQVASVEGFESHQVVLSFKHIEDNKGALGELLREMQFAESFFQKTNQILQEKLPLVCEYQKNSLTAQHLANVLNKYFVKHSQSLLNQHLHQLKALEKEALQWQILLPQQWSNLSSVSDLTSKPLLSQRVTEGVRQHVKIWSDFSTQCNVNLTP